MITAGAAPVRSRTPSRMRRAEASGSSGSSEATSPRHVGDVDAGIGADEPVTGAADDQAAVGHADDGRRLAQDDLDLARVLVPRRAQSRASATARPMRGRPAALRLRDDLLGHDEHVGIGEAEAGGSRGVGDERREVVARPDLGDARRGR